MALVKVLNEYDLQREFREYDRDCFSLEGYEAILELFEECDCGKNTDLDVIGICCEFTEESAEYIISNYDNIEEIADCKDEDGNIDTESLLDALSYYTLATELSNGHILYHNF